MPDDQDGATDGTNQARGVAVAEDGSVVVVGYTLGDWNATNQGDIVHSLSLNNVRQSRRFELDARSRDESKDMRPTPRRHGCLDARLHRFGGPGRFQA